MKRNSLLLISCLFIWSSCSLIKDPTSSNFLRVKYNSHLKLAEKSDQKKLPKTVESFVENNELEKIDGISLEKSTLEAYNPEIKEQELMRYEPKLKESKFVEKMLVEVSHDIERMSVSSSTKSKSMDWWEDDPENWPWGQLVLAVIAILIIAILIVLLIDILGAIVSSLLGLILLLALAYLLYEYWV